MRTLIARIDRTLVDDLDIQCAILDQSSQVLQISTAGHVHVDTRTSTAESGIPPVPGKALDDQACDGKRVADHEAFEPPLASQDIP